MPEYLTRNTVVADWYPRIQTVQSCGAALAVQKDKVYFQQEHLALLDYEALFFEAGNFHPEFILWLLHEGKQYVTFIEPHGLLHEGPASEKALFHKRIKDVQKRMDAPRIVLNSFISLMDPLPTTEMGRFPGRTRRQARSFHDRR